MTRCLVVDDSRIMRKLARAMLEELHFDTAEAEDSDAALQYCRADTPELIILDLDLPNGGGIEFLRKLRQVREGKQPVAVVFCATENDIGQITAALKAGANDFVQKPFNGPDLLAKLAAVGLIDRAALGRSAA